ncbi:MAG: multidrug DMT transporter permease [Gammaproteobacteria bacterium]|nr:MAG: multidrug DMT transporter permease [Gammaproteobacteria bacterium]PCJ46887.1 MAG: multidrug DMT transporter permease [Gammaproteobacteria bacterium]
MFIVESYTVAVSLILVTMICWGSWANTQKLASKEWSFPLFYWDYAIGVMLFSLILGLTAGSSGTEGQGFIANLAQASTDVIISALIGGIIFNIANLLLVAAIDIAGLAVAFPIAIGLALVLGVVDNYIQRPVGDPTFLFLGVALVTIAIILNAISYKRLQENRQDDTSGGIAKGIGISVAAGILMGFFYGFIAKTLPENFAEPTIGLLTPYSSVFIFSLGVLFSNFIFNTFFMYKPVSGGDPVTYGDYFSKGTPKLHLIGLLGGFIWCTGLSLNIIASGSAGPAISYGLGQGATMVAAAWGVFVWKEFAGAPQGTNKLIGAMFLCFIIGLSLIIYARG